MQNSNQASDSLLLAVSSMSCFTTILFLSSSCSSANNLTNKSLLSNVICHTISSLALAATPSPKMLSSSDPSGFKPILLTQKDILTMSALMAGGECYVRHFFSSMRGVIY